MVEASELLSLVNHNQENTWAREIESVTKRLGCDFVFIGVVPGHQKNFDAAYVKTNYPSQWKAAYNRGQFHRIDPKIAYCKENTLPVHWDSPSLNDAIAQTLFDSAATHGVKSGITLPLHGPDIWGKISLASSSLSNDQLKERLQPSMGSIVVLRDLIGATAPKFMRKESDLVQCNLSGKEMDCLNLAMQGKTSKEISQALSRAEDTVNYHFRNVFQKLQVNTRSQAITKALQMGLIKL